MHNVPLEFLTIGNARVIGSKIGTLVEVEDPSGDLGIGKGFLKISTWIKVENPMLDGFWILRKNGRRIWASCKYEKLLDFCLWKIRVSGEELCRRSKDGS